MDEFRVQVVALDKPFGYNVKAIGTVGGTSAEFNEHYLTEDEAKARLATAWQWWANQVDSEPNP